MKAKHGTSQYRLNHAKDYAKSFVEDVQNMELMWQLSMQEHVDETLADGYIKRSIEEIESKWEEFKSYISYREDMK